MLDAYIIDQLRREEEEHQRSEQSQPQLELPEPPRPVRKPEPRCEHVIYIKL